MARDTEKVIGFRFTEWTTSHMSSVSEKLASSFIDVNPRQDDKNFQWTSQLIAIDIIFAEIAFSAEKRNICISIICSLFYAALLTSGQCRSGVDTWEWEGKYKGNWKKCQAQAKP